jgi:hypothetical protein
MCRRYCLLLEVERNGRLLSVSFEVLSHSGDLLVSCRKYSVTWVPRGVVIQERKAVEDPNSWFRNRCDIVYTAAVVNDATIASTNVAGFENVLRPKVIGSWNLHITSQDFNLALELFVLFSRTK